MNDILDLNLITKFRDKVNSDSYFILHKYKNIENKNKWNIICSCMDWISVSIRTINFPTKKINNLDSQTIEVYMYISLIDIIYEAINQLHRVLIDNKTIPFQNQNNIFKDTTGKDDNEYFKHIRSIFGAHPVNIKDKDGQQWFASWPYPSDNEKYDFQVSLYSNDLNKQDIIFGIKFSKLNEFLFQRYTYLNTLIDEIDEQFKQYCLRKQNQLIERKNNILEQLDILTKESRDRLNNDYYVNIIEDLKILFDTKLDYSLELFEIKYKKKLKEVMNEVLNNLQKMEIVDLKTDKIIFPDYNSQIFYELSKLLICLTHDNYDPLFSHYIKQINKKSTNEIILNENDSREELYLKLKIIMYYKMWI
jgi:hypothetical protein